MNYLIIGANAAGLSAAMRILKFDKTAKIVVLEKTDVISFGSCGIPYYISREFTDIERMTARTFDEFQALGMTIHLFHTAQYIDFESKIVFAIDQTKAKLESFSYDKLMMATGASPVFPKSIKGIESVKPLLQTVHSKYDAINLLNRLPKVQKIVVIGGGFIGVEIAEAFSMHNKSVTLIESRETILTAGFDQEIAKKLEEELIKNKITLKLNTQVMEITQQDPQSSCLTVTTNNENKYDVDLVVLAIGFQPNTQFLRDQLNLTPEKIEQTLKNQLNSSNIENQKIINQIIESIPSFKQHSFNLSNEGAIIIDRYCQTNIDSVFAAGDCATVPHCILTQAYIPLATSANKLGRLAGDSMAGIKKEFIGTLGSSGIRVFNLEAGRTGITEIQAQRLGIDYGVVWIQDKNHTDYIEGQSDIWVKLIYEKQSKCLIGGQICGEYQGGAIHRIDTLAVCIYKKMTVEELGMMDFIYAPPFSRTWSILNIAGNVAK